MDFAKIINLIKYINVINVEVINLFIKMETKISMTIVLTGRTMYQKEECLKTTQKVIEKTSKKTGKTYKKKVNVLVDDPDKMDSYTLKVVDYIDKKPVSEVITFHTRKTKPATQSLNIYKDAYNYMISGECPYWSKPKVWNNLSVKERLEAHLQRIAKGLGGTSYTYQIFED